MFTFNPLNFRTANFLTEVAQDNKQQLMRMIQSGASATSFYVALPFLPSMIFIFESNFALLRISLVV